MPPKQMRYVVVDKVRQLMDGKGWSPKSLAEKAAIDPGTVANALNGEKISIEKVAQIAKAFGIEPGEIIRGEAPKEEFVTIQVVLKKITKEEFLRLGVDHFIERMKSGIDAQHDIQQLNIAYSSVILTLAIHEDDALQLVRAFSTSKLDSLEISSILVPRTSIIVLLAALIAHDMHKLMLLLFAGLLYGIIQKSIPSNLRFIFRSDNWIEIQKTNITNASISSSQTGRAGAAVTRDLVGLATPEELSSFPQSITISASPEASEEPLNSNLNNRLENALRIQFGEERVSRREEPVTNPNAALLNGKLRVEIRTNEELRDLTGAILSEFLNEAVMISIRREASHNGPWGWHEYSSTNTFSLNLKTWLGVFSSSH